MPSLRPWILGAALVSALGACSGSIPIDVTVGPVGFSVDASRIAIPASFQSSGLIARVPCASTAQCPSLGASAPTLACVGGACDPAPFTFDLGLMSVVDLAAYSSRLGVVGDGVQSITITRMTWEAAAAGLRGAVGPVDVYWGPETATGISSDGVQRLARIATLQFSSTGTASGDAQVDAAGNTGLSNHLLRVSRRFRFFARASVDLSPGGPLPAGRATIDVRMRLRAETNPLP